MDLQLRVSTESIHIEVEQRMSEDETSSVVVAPLRNIYPPTHAQTHIVLEYTYETQ